MRAGRSIKATAFVVGKMLRHFGQVVRYGEGQQVVRGRGLVARLARTLFDLGTTIWLSSPVERLTVADGAVTGATVRTERGPVAIGARRGVVLASGASRLPGSRRWAPTKRACSPAPIPERAQPWVWE